MFISIVTKIKLLNALLKIVCIVCIYKHFHSTLKLQKKKKTIKIEENYKIYVYSLYFQL